jgi:rhamnosyltransferase
VIPVKNGEPWLHDCLQAIMRQTLFHQTEIGVLDSGSTDRTLEILEQYPVRVYHIPSGQFNHGLTRNFGVQQCQGKYVVMTVQDAKPVDDRWLQKLMDGFSAAENIAGVCGQQVVPHDRDKNPVDWFRAYSEPQIKICKVGSEEDYNKLTPGEKKAACSWDDVNAAYLREVMLRFPFQKIAYGEDALWAQEVLKAGYTLAYNPAARVYHYHNEDWNFTFKRSLTVMHLWYRNFGYLYPQKKRSFRSFLSMIKTIATAGSLSPKEKWNWYVYNRNRHDAMKQAHHVFLEALSKGEETLDEVHQKHCGKPPVPLQPVVRQTATHLMH